MKTITIGSLLLLVLMLVTTQAMATGIGLYGGVGKRVSRHGVPPVRVVR